MQVSLKISLFGNTLRTSFNIAYRCITKEVLYQTNQAKCNEFNQNKLIQVALSMLLFLILPEIGHRKGS